MWMMGALSVGKEGRGAGASKTSNTCPFDLMPTYLATKKRTKNVIFSNTLTYISASILG